MAASKVDVQVLSVCPQTFVYAQPPALAAAFARIQNEQLAKLVKARPDRFLAIGTLPMQAPKLAADELRHAVSKLGLRGVQIGSMSAAILIAVVPVVVASFFIQRRLVQGISGGAVKF